MTWQSGGSSSSYLRLETHRLEPELLLLLLLPLFRVVVGRVEVAWELTFVVGDVANGGVVVAGVVVLVVAVVVIC